MSEDKYLKNLTNQSKKILLSENEKQIMKSEMLRFMKNNPIQEVHLAGWSWQLMFQRPALRYASIISAFSLVIFCGISFAANGTLPGDVLYPVKTGVNEKVLGLLQVSDEAKAEYSLQLVQTRLSELEKVTINKGLDDKTNNQIQTLIDKNINDVSKYSEKIEHNNNYSTSLNINSDLEASLNAHNQVLHQLSKQENDGSAANLDKAISNVKSRISVTRKDREDNESKAVEDVSSGLKKVAQNSIDNANDLLKNINNFIDDKQSSISVESYQSAKDNLNVAGDQLNQAIADFSNTDYKSALSLSQQAMRSAKETKISFQASLNLNIIVPQISQHDWKEKSHNDEKKKDFENISD